MADARAFKRALANDDAREMREVLSRMRARGFSQADFHGLFPSRALRDAVRAISAGGAR